MATEKPTIEDAEDVTLAYARPMFEADMTVAPAAIPVPQATVAELGIAPVAGNDYAVAFDPAEATVSLEGRDLVFTFGSGTRTVLKDFVSMAPDANVILPDGRLLPSGSLLVEMQALAQGYDASLEIETAAGGEPAASGGGHASGDTFGRVIAMLDAQGVIEPARDGVAKVEAADSAPHALPSEEDEEDEEGEPAPPQATISVVDVWVAEDGTAATADQTSPDVAGPVAVTIEFTVTLTDAAATELTGITLSGFPEGVAIITPGWTDQGGGVWSTSTAFALNGGPITLEVAVPQHADTDLALDVEVTVAPIGGGAEEESEAAEALAVVIDAVADPATFISAGATADESGNSESPGGQPLPANTVRAGEGFTLDFQATFHDAADGSEQHRFLVALPEGWATSGTTVTLDANNAYGVPAGAYLSIDADPLIDTATGVASGSAHLTAPAAAGASLQIVPVTIYAASQETAAGAGENPANNAANASFVVNVSVVAGDTLLLGSDDEDTLAGGGGDDVLFGGDGSDFLSGGAGSDLFVIGIDDGVDVVADFDAANDASPDNDVLDLSALFAGGVSGAPVEAYVSIVSGPTGAVVTINADGMGADFAPIATLAGVGAGETVQVVLDRAMGPVAIEVL